MTRVGREEGGAGVRHTVYQMDPAALDEAIAGYEDTAVPWLTETDGFVSAALLVDHRLDDNSAKPFGATSTRW